VQLRCQKVFANVKVTTLNKPDKQDPTAPAKDFRPIGSGAGSRSRRKIAQNPMAREMDPDFDHEASGRGSLG